MYVYLFVFLLCEMFGAQFFLYFLLQGGLRASGLMS